MPSLAPGAEGLERPAAGDVTLRFGAAFSLSGKQCTHRGVDIAAEQGEVVLAAADGVVTFAGEVPADGGGRTVAVTVTTPEGLLVCVMPLERASVRAGDSVSTGDGVGELAGTGDASSASPHVHLSVRRGGAYIDPEPLLREGGSATEAADVVSGSGAEPTDGHADLLGSQTRLQPSTGPSTSIGRSSAGASAFVAPALTAAQAGAIRQAFSAEIARMRSGHGRLRTSGFREPTFADTVRAAVPRTSAVVPVGSIGVGVLSVAALGGMLARKLRSEAATVRAGWRQL